MRLLQRGFEVETRYGGAFVQEIDGVGGGRRGGRPVDWFFYVNGIEAETRRRGAAARARRPRVVGPPRLGRRDARPRRRRLLSRAVRVGLEGQAGAGADRLRRERAARVPRGAEAARGRGREGRRARRRSARRPTRACCACSSGAGPRSAATRRRAASRAGRRSRASSRCRRPRATGSRCSTRAGRPCGRSARAPASSPRRASSTSSRPGSWRGPTTAASTPRRPRWTRRGCATTSRSRSRTAARSAAAAGRRRAGDVTYRRRASPLHAARAGVGSLFCVVLAGVALSFEHPVLLGGDAGSRCCWPAPARASATWSRARCCGGCRSRC